MRNAEKVESFIRSVFEVYGLDYNQYFSAYTADDEKIILPMVIDSKLDMAMVHRAAEILGEDVEDLLAMNSKKTANWQNRFPYIFLRNSFEYACRRSYYKKNYDALRLMEAIWDINIPNKPMRYDYKDVTRRMHALLKEYDKVAPGTYHEGSNCDHLQIITTSFCHFAELEKMMESFFEMIERARTLFFKTLGQNLSAEEINEYNIIVSVLGIQDRYIPQRGELHYSMLHKLAPVYKAEQKTDFFDYVVLDPAKDIAPWRCVEFIQNRDMVQVYATIVPYAKKAMREYALLVTQFHCRFTWSDSVPMAYSPAGGDMFSEIGSLVQYSRLCEAYGGSEIASIYVPKNAEEIGEDGPYADILGQLAGPVAKGGIAVSTGAQRKVLDIPKITSRIRVLGGNRHV